MPDPFPHTAEALRAVAMRLLVEARIAGASDATVTVSESAHLNAQVREGRIKSLSREGRSGAALTVYRGRRQGSTHSTDLAPASLIEMARAACTIARHTAEDPHAGLADAADLCRDPVDLDLFHPWQPGADELVATARRMEAGLADAGGGEVTSDGTVASAGQRHVWRVDSRGFDAGYAQSMHLLSASAIAQRGAVRIREGWTSDERRAADLDAPEQVGAEAARRARALLAQRPVPSGVHPVLFDARSATSLLGHLAGAIGGSLLVRKMSFLGERFGRAILPEHVDVTEDPFVPGGRASAPFDSDGIAGTRRAIVERGVLRGALLDTYAARRLGLRPTGNAGGCHNLRLTSRRTGPADDATAMRRRLGTGLLVTGLSGDGVRLINGDYSRVARGFWVEDGEIVHAVDGAALARDLPALWAGLRAVGADAYTAGPFTTGSILFDGMRIASR